ncbi:MAG: hypothetical protein H6733_05710 [Alphaproteobacteria bacterium]|nr:hypothetical protein [Alphaproteobacteria bacterium]
MNARTSIIYLVLAAVGLGIGALLIRGSGGPRNQGASLEQRLDDEDDAGGKRGRSPKEIAASKNAGRMVRTGAAAAPAGGADPSFGRIVEKRSDGMTRKLTSMRDALDVEEDDTTAKDLMLTYERKSLALAGRVQAGDLTDDEARAALDALDDETLRAAWDVWGNDDEALLDKFLGAR